MAIKDSSCQEETRLIAVRMGPPPQHLQHQILPPHPPVHGAANFSPLQQLSQYWSCLARAIKYSSCQEETRLIAIRMGPPPQYQAEQARPTSERLQQPTLAPYRLPPTLSPGPDRTSPPSSCMGDEDVGPLYSSSLLDCPQHRQQWLQY